MPDSQVIPKIIHRVWLGGQPLPSDHIAWGETWREHHPDWAIWLWTDENLHQLVDPGLLEPARNASERSNVVRLHALARYGGVYVDTDVECLRSIEPLLGGVSAFAGDERGEKVGTAVLGAVPGHPALTRGIAEVTVSLGRGDQLETSGPKFVARLLSGLPDVTIFPREVFYPFRWFELPDGRSLEGAYAIHHLAGSWVDPAWQIGKLKALLARSEARRARSEAALVRVRSRVARMKRHREAGRAGLERRLARAESRAERAERRLSKAREKLRARRRKA